MFGMRMTRFSLVEGVLRHSLDNKDNVPPRNAVVFEILTALLKSKSKKMRNENPTDEG